MTGPTSQPNYPSLETRRSRNFHITRYGTLSDRRGRNGPASRLSADQQVKVAQWVEQGPDLERDGVARWRCVDLQQRIAREFAVRFHERTVGKLLRKLAFRRLSVRPRHPQSKPEAQELFKLGSLVL